MSTSATGGRQPDPTEILIIGAGPAGATLARYLGEAGLRIVCLEQGPWVRPEERPHHADDWELQRLGRWHHDPNQRRLPQDYPITGNSILPYVYNGVGGTTLHFSGHWPRLRPSDFRKGAEHGLAPDWPITYEDLHPFYEMVDQEIGVSGLAGDPANPPRGPRPCPPLAPGPLGRHAAAAFRKLGWHCWPADMALVTTDFDGRPGCVDCGLCQAGCPRGSLSSADVCLWPRALRYGVDLRPNCRVERIVLGPDGRASGAVYIDRPTGLRYEQRAEVVIVCANGIGTPRLLLLSAAPGCPEGLANSSGMVGRHLMLHAVGAAEYWLDAPTEGYKGAFGFPLASFEFAETDPRRGCVNGVMLQVLRSFGPASLVAGGYSGLAAPWGERHHAWFAQRFGRGLGIGIVAEDLPQPTNQVTLDPDATDSSGLPAARVSYRPHPNDLRLLRFGIARAAELGDAMGAVAISSGLAADDEFVPNAWHLLGTCRMGNAPATSVTNRWHQSWDVPNLFICDGSSFVTSGAVNPTSTICALAARLAHYLRANRDRVRTARRTTAEG